MNTINWKIVKEYKDITYKKANGVARVAFNRPEVRNAFRPRTVGELFEALVDALGNLNLLIQEFREQLTLWKEHGILHKEK